MKVLVVVDGHLGRTPDGRVWSERIYTYDFFARYLSVFDSVRVAMRIHDIATNTDYPNLCSGDCVEFIAIEEFKGPTEYAKKYLKIQRNISGFIDGCDCAIFRIPSTIGYQFWKAYRKKRKPYAIEVVVDPWDFAAPGMLTTPLRPIIRWLWTSNLKKACLEANGVAYVTREALQLRYPSYARLHGDSTTKFEGYYSSVNIPEDYLTKPRTYQKLKKCEIVHITNFIGNHVKGHEELIKALKIVRSKTTVDVSVKFIGEGSLIDEFKKMAENEGVGESVRFIGKFSNGNDVKRELLKSDLFVFPSHAEGLPRVVIEAMAVGLPIISTKANGIPELIDNYWLTEVGEIDCLAEKIIEMIEDPVIMTKQSLRNINVARDYTEPVLQRRRKEFYSRLRALIE